MLRCCRRAGRCVRQQLWQTCRTGADCSGGGAVLGRCARCSLLPQHQHRKDRGKPKCLDAGGAVLTGGRLTVGRDASGYEMTVTYSAEQVYTALLGLALRRRRYKTPPPTGSARVCGTKRGIWRRCRSAGRCLPGQGCAVRSVCGLQRSPWTMTRGRTHLPLRPALRPRRGPEPVRRESHGRAGQELAGNFGMVLSGV